MAGGGDALGILVPVLGRPHRVRPLLDSIAKATPEAEVIFIADPGDRHELSAIMAAGAEHFTLRGNYAEKINAAVEATERPLLFLGADDLEFHPGWFELAEAELSDEIGVVGTNDLCNGRVMRGTHSTHSLVARWYAELGTIDDPTRLLHEGYPHEFVDDEFIQTARVRGAFAPCLEAIVEHLHPWVGKAPTDGLYKGIRARIRAGRPIYHERRKLWT